MGKGGGTGHRRNPEFSPPTIKGSRGRRGWDEGGLDFKIIATDIAGSACIIEAEGPPPPVPLPGLETTGPEEGRGGLGVTSVSQEPNPGDGRNRGFPLPHTHPWEFGAGGDEDSFYQRRYLRWWDSAKGSLGGAREVLSSSAAEAAAAATRMDFLSHPNSTVQRSSPQSGGIPPASDAAVAAAPRARLDETKYSSVWGGRLEAKTPLQEQKMPQPQ